jgi:3-hydroxyisobutyrate dehydrogenase-like beta-hydroxyacid dehydrogenase
MNDVTVIGLGPMGLALADLMLKSGKSLDLWNRSAGKAQALLARGATLASTPSQAIASSPVALICVYDYQAADAILHADDVPEALNGKLIINLGTGGPEEVKRLAAHVQDCGGRYLDGAIQAAPSQMGTDDTPLLVSGPASCFAQALPLLRILAGNPIHLGEKIEDAACMDLATLSHVYGAYAGFMHGARVAEASGIDVATYGRLVNSMASSFGAFFEHQAGVIAAADFGVSESPLRISVPAVRRILTESQRLGLNTDLPTLMDRWLGLAQAAGMMDEELAALIKVLRPQEPLSSPPGHASAIPA